MKEHIDTTFEVKFRRSATTGIVTAEHWLLDGKGESPPGDRPSTILYDDEGRAKTLIWKKRGEPHRENGPAWIDVDPTTGGHVLEQFSRMDSAIAVRDSQRVLRVIQRLEG